MQIKIFVHETDLEELSLFLKSGINYEHNVDFMTYFDEVPWNGQGVEVSVFYDDYVRLRDWKMKKNLLL